MLKGFIPEMLIKSGCTLCICNEYSGPGDWNAGIFLGNQFCISLSILLSYDRYLNVMSAGQIA